MRDFAALDRINKSYRNDPERRERKLQLVQQVRSRYHEDRYDMSNRERILYGRTSISDTLSQNSGYGEDAVPDPEDSSLSSFKLRFLIALILFGIIVFMDRNQIAIGGITSEKLYGMVSADYEEKLEEWVEAMSGSAQN